MTVISLRQYAICFISSLASYFCPIPFSGVSSERQAKWSTKPQNEDVVQVRFQLVLPVPASCDSKAYLEDVRDSFLKSYKNETKFQMSLQGLGTGSWHLDGRVMFTSSCKLRNARQRIKTILMKCHERLRLSHAEIQAFNQHLGQTANLNVKKDTEPFAEEGHRWNVDGSSGEHNAQGALLHFLLIAPALPRKMHVSLRTSPGPLGKIQLPLFVVLSRA
jgi:hypothetical protein